MSEIEHDDERYMSHVLTADCAGEVGPLRELSRFRRKVEWGLWPRLGPRGRL